MPNKKISELTDGGALQATDEVEVARAGDNYRIAGSQFGGSSPGAARVLGPFPFAHDTPGLLAGIEVWTPSAGDILLDAIIVALTAWNGTTPHCDFGTSGNYPLIQFGGSYSVNLAHAADGTQGGPGTLVLRGAASARDWNTVGIAYDIMALPNPVAPGSLLNSTALDNGVSVIPFFPLIFTAAVPLKVWVSQDGYSSSDGGGGVSPGSTQGTADLYLMVATPSLT